jgi:ectoine hydroxylase-related dioxygenase (phytanoyl-CoA dioxygenase family)
MQSLLFAYGSEQGIHQDFAFVHAEVPRYLVGAWIACDRVDAENGPLLYYPGSHRIPAFDFGGGDILYRNQGHDRLEAFERYLAETCRDRPAEFLHADPGDVLLWHAALVHAGSPVQDHTRTRRSFVCHYSSQRAYTHDRRCPDRLPEAIALNGGTYFACPYPGHREGRYAMPEAHRADPSPR